MTTSMSTTNYKPCYYQSPRKADKIIFGSHLLTQGSRAIASTLYKVYFNHRKNSQNNLDFYDVKQHDYYIICKNSTFKGEPFYLNNDSITKGKYILKTLHLIRPVPQNWNRPDRIFLDNFKTIHNSMTFKKSSFSHANSQPSGKLNRSQLLQHKNTSKKILNNINNTRSNTESNEKSKSETKSESDILYAQKINRWVYSTANCLHTPGVSKQHAKSIVTLIARMANKDYDNARHLFHIITSWWKNIQTNYNIGKYQRIGIENIPGLYDKLNHIYTYQLDPTYKKVSLKRFMGYITNAIRKFYVQCAYHLKDSLDPYYFNEAKMSEGAKVEHPDNRPAAINNQPLTKGPKIPLHVKL